MKREWKRPLEQQARWDSTPEAEQKWEALVKTLNLGQSLRSWLSRLWKHVNTPHRACNFCLMGLMQNVCFVQCPTSALFSDTAIFSTRQLHYRTPQNWRAAAAWQLTLDGMNRCGETVSHTITSSNLTRSRVKRHLRQGFFCPRKRAVDFTILIAAQT